MGRKKKDDEGVRESQRLGRIGEGYSFEKISMDLKEGEALLDLTPYGDALKAYEVDLAVVKEGVTAEMAVRSIIDGTREGLIHLYEIKTDTKMSCYDPLTGQMPTGNMVYEKQASMYRFGWVDLTVADEVYYYGLDKDEEIIEAFSIEPQKLRDFGLRVQRLPDREKICGLTKSALLKSGPPRGGNVSYSCPMWVLVECGVARKLEVNRDLAAKHRGMNSIEKFFKDVILKQSNEIQPIIER